MSIPNPNEPVRRSRTRKALVEAGKRLMASGRMGAATIDEIVREADVAKGSFYNHFTDREALIECAMMAVQEELQVTIGAAIEGIEDISVSLTVGVLASFRYGMANPTGARVLLALGSGAADPGHQRNARLARRLQFGMSQGVFQLPNLDAGVILVIGLSDLGLSRLLDLTDQPELAKETAKGVCYTLLRGLGVPARKVESTVAAALKIDRERGGETARRV